MTPSTPKTRAASSPPRLAPDARTLPTPGPGTASPPPSPKLPGGLAATDCAADGNPPAVLAPPPAASATVPAPKRGAA